MRALAGNVISAASGWPTPHDLHVVYCTARIKGRGNTSGQKDQDVYLRALNASGAVDVVEYGTYVERIATSPLATAGKGGRPVISQATWPLMVKDSANGDVPGATFIASISRREEKGSDVNVATHLLLDVLQQNVDTAVVISNDSDLKKPIEVARGSVPVGLVNPTKNYPAGALNGDPNAGAGGHRWYQLTAADLHAAQMPASLGPKITRPDGW